MGPVRFLPTLRVSYVQTVNDSITVLWGFQGRLQKTFLQEYWVENYIKGVIHTPPGQFTGNPELYLAGCS